MMKPFQIVWELIEFGIQAAFVYLLAIIIFIGILFIVIKDNQQSEPIVIYKERIVKEQVTVVVTPERECTRPAGCRVNNETGEIEW